MVLYNQNIMTDSLLEQWKLASLEDFNSAKSLFRDGFYLNSCFHLQQSLEKYLKMFFIWHKKDQPPYIHNLVRIAEEAGLYNDFNEEQRFLLDTLNSYYINARYPSYKKNLSIDLDKNKVSSYINKTEDFLKCLENKMK